MKQIAIKIDKNYLEIIIKSFIHEIVNNQLKTWQKYFDDRWLFLKSFCGPLRVENFGADQAIEKKSIQNIRTFRNVQLFNESKLKHKAMFTDKNKNSTENYFLLTKQKQKKKFSQ